MAVQVGTPAPSFTLVDTDKKPRSLDEFKGKKLVIAFFPGAFTGVCTKEMCALRDSMSKFNELDAQVVGISVDSPFANRGFSERYELKFPLLSDYTRTAVRAYGVELQNFSGLEGYTVAQRSVFVLDQHGIIRYAWVAENPGIEPNYDEITKAVSSI
jgi:peroxiredoxin